MKPGWLRRELDNAAKNVNEWPDWMKNAVERVRCHADRDGDCTWAFCPQLRDYQRYCPIAKATESDDD